MEIGKFIHLNKLYSVYKNILTKKQNEILSLLLNEDLSLGEISEELSISRQAVHDAIKRSEQALLDCEEKLGVLAKEEFVQKQAERAIELLNSFDCIDNNAKRELLKICEELHNGI